MESVKKIDNQRKEKLIKEIDKEQQLLESMKGKKAPKDAIEKIIDRLYSDAERRRLARESKIEEMEKVKSNDESPSKYKKKPETIVYKY
jgi:carboxypeptidase C (cathepsin A)